MKTLRKTSLTFGVMLVLLANSSLHAQKAAPSPKDKLTELSLKYSSAVSSMNDAQQSVVVEVMSRAEELDPKNTKDADLVPLLKALSNVSGFDPANMTGDTAQILAQKYGAQRINRLIKSVDASGQLKSNLNAVSSDGNDVK